MSESENIEMNRLDVTVLSLALLTLGGSKANRDGGAHTAPTSPVPDPQAGAPLPGGGAEKPRVPFVRVAELEIDPARLEAYTVAVKEEMETSVRVEPGVLAMNAVAEKNNPSKLRFFEMYADEAAYHAHIASAHFKKYATTTKDMITSRRLIDTVPVQLSAKKN